MTNTYHGIACAVQNKRGKILLLKRSPDKKFFPNKWFVVGAYPLGEDEDFDKKTHIELVDETGFDGKIINRGEVLKMEMDGRVIDVHTYLADRTTDEVKLNNEHTEYKWVGLQEIKKYDVIPGTFEMIDNLVKA
jgi:isopentenyldiphosphate isomerase